MRIASTLAGLSAAILGLGLTSAPPAAAVASGGASCVVTVASDQDSATTTCSNGLDDTVAFQVYLRCYDFVANTYYWMNTGYVDVAAHSSRSWGPVRCPSDFIHGTTWDAKF